MTRKGGRPASTALFLSLVVVLSGCSSARIAGGEVVTPGSEPEGTQIALYRTRQCRDARGGRLVELDAKVKLLRRKDQKVVLIDSRLGYDTVVTDNGALEGDAWVFDVALKKVNGKPYVRQYRLPVSGGGEGRYLLSARFEDRDTDEAFRARILKPAIECALTAA